MFEFLFQIVGEFLLQLSVEILIELGFHSLAEPLRRRPNPWLAAIGYALFGLIAGILSLTMLDYHLIGNKPAQILNLVLTPLAVGLAMAQMGAWRERRGDSVLRIDRFAYGYLFALTFAIVRFYFAN